MIRAINSLPWAVTLFAYGVLAWGLLVVLLFIGRYAAKLRWRSTEEGRHLVAMSGSVGAFFVLYLVQAFVPDIPGRPWILVSLLVILVAVCTWRWILLEKHLRARRRAALLNPGEKHDRPIRTGHQPPPGPRA